LPSEHLHAFLRSRRSVRRFQEKEIPADLVERILETATWAPSSHNRQPWRFVVLAAKEARIRLAEEMGNDFRRDLLADGLAKEEVERFVERSRNRMIEAPLAIIRLIPPAWTVVGSSPAGGRASDGCAKRGPGGGLLLTVCRRPGGMDAAFTPDRPAFA
jgi:nitroreductase